MQSFIASLSGRFIALIVLLVLGSGKLYSQQVGIMPAGGTVCPGDWIRYDISSFTSGCGYDWTITSGTIRSNGVTSTGTLTNIYSNFVEVKWNDNPVMLVNGVKTLNGTLKVERSSTCSNGYSSKLETYKIRTVTSEPASIQSGANAIPYCSVAERTYTAYAVKYTNDPTIEVPSYE